MITVKKFYAEWCGPCKVLTPIMEQVRTKFGQVTFENVDHVRSVPTVIVEKDGVEVNRLVGVQSEMAYSNTINENL